MPTVTKLTPAIIIGLLILTVSIDSGKFFAAEVTQILHPIPGTPLAPDFSLQDIDGKTHTLKAYRGKVVILNFWATWCPPCREELPSMERAFVKLKDRDVILLGIDVGEDSDTIFTFSADYPVSFPLLLDTDSNVIKSYGVVGLPTTYVVDKRGRLVYRVIGTRQWDAPEIIKILTSL
ncbi:MAG: peroxiredoxin family protein [Thiohalomonadales bacterium]